MLDLSQNCPKEIYLTFDVLWILWIDLKFTDLKLKVKESLNIVLNTKNLDQILFLSTSNFWLLFLLLADEEDEQSIKLFCKACSEFNKLQEFSGPKSEVIDIFSYCISKLASFRDLQNLWASEEHKEKVSNAYDDVITKLMEIVYDKEAVMELRIRWVEDYFPLLYKFWDVYREQIDDLRQQFIEYDQYQLHKAIGINASKLLKEKDLDEYFASLQDTIGSKDSTLIAKRASVVHLSMFILHSELIKNCQDKLLKFQSIFFKYMFDKKEEIQEYASSVLTKLYQLGDEETKKKLVKDLNRALGGKQNFSELQEKEDDFELNIEYDPNSPDAKKIKTFKDLCDIAVDLGHNELIYQFLNIHRHLTHYKNIKRAADSLHGIVLEDEEVKNDLLKTIPKIFVMTYDYNEDIRDTMKEVMASLVPPEKENKIILEKWDDIISELVEAVNNKNEFRKRLSGLHGLADIIDKGEWDKIKLVFESLFVVAFKLTDDPNDNVKRAAFLLMKSLKKLTLRNGNIYTCTDLGSLKSMYSIVLPLLLKQGIPSHLKIVKMFSVTLLNEILETSKEESVVDKLKFKNSREDRQLNYTYNSKQKMREIMQPYLKEIIVLIIDSISEFESEMWAKVETQIGFAQQESKGDLEHYLNDQRIKSSKDSMLYDILAVSKDLL